MLLRVWMLLTAVLRSLKTTSAKLQGVRIREARQYAATGFTTFHNVVEPQATTPFCLSLEITQQTGQSAAVQCRSENNSPSRAMANAAR
jgi:hypothetical protein